MNIFKALFPILVLSYSTNVEADMTRNREEISEEFQWSVQDLYPDLTAWEEDLERVKEEKQAPFWPELGSFKGRLSEGADVLSNFLNYYFSIDRSLSKLYTYAHLRYDENLTENDPKRAYGLIQAIYSAFQMEASWVEPEILQLSDSVFQEYMNNPLLQEYTVYLSKVHRMKPHTLSSREEELMAMSSQALHASARSFSAFDNADLTFPKIKDSQGKEHDLTSSLYMKYIREDDRKLRKEAFEGLHYGYAHFENTLCEMIQGQVQTHIFNAKARSYENALQASLFPHQVDPAVYTHLIEAVHEKLDTLHRYLAWRKQQLGYDELHPYDLYVPMISNDSFKMDYEQARKYVVESVALLGEEYQTSLKEGLYDNQWVDVYENRGKRSGAYSSGCYDSYPYILMNYQGNLNDVLTLAHEAGHSMHSFLSRNHQSYQDSQYPIFVAEVASTFNEQMLLHLLKQKAKTEEEKALLLLYQIEGIRTTLFRQTLFAEFELKIHQLVEAGIPLTPALLKEEYYKLNDLYYGKEVVLDAGIESEWSRIPHFYYNFYVYQYATGISSAIFLFQQILKDPDTQEPYLNFLKSGGSKYPLDLLENCGVDLRTGNAVRAALHQFESWIDELEKISRKTFAEK